MKIVLISDTHCQLDKITLPDGDLILHAGDLTYRGNTEEMSYEIKVLGEMAKKCKYGCISICGNHDWLGQNNPEKTRQLFKDAGVTYLQDEEVVINGLHIYGSPWQPEFYNWAFNLPRGKPLADIWAKIPENTDILITHGPPYRFGDIVIEGYGGCWPDADFKNKKLHVGCKDLLKRVKVVKPKYHVFGHIHDGHGIYKNKGTTFINAAICNERYEPLHEPIVIEV